MTLPFDTVPGRVRFDEYAERPDCGDCHTPAQAFYAIHGEAPNTPLTHERCDALAGGNPAIRGALIGMFSGPAFKENTDDA